MNCTELQELAALRALGVLEPSDAARLGASVAHDPEARAEVAALADAAAALAHTAPVQTPPPALRERLLAQTDPHAPPRFRVNGVVSNMPEFQKAFSCKAGDPMVRSESCLIW